MNRILALDTSTEACSAAVLAGDRVIARYEEPGRGHSERILPMVGEVLHESGLKLADLDAIAVGRGPGAFTGVRIGISVAQGLAFGADKKVAPVSDLAALAQRAIDDFGAGLVLAAIDARMSEIYWALYEKDADGLAALVGQEQVGPAEGVALPPHGAWHGAGSGWKVDALQLRRHSLTEGGEAAEHTHAHLFPRAQEVARLGRALLQRGLAVAPELALPVYLRDQVATPMSQKSRV